ncbi:MAG: hypothetical protein FWC86_05155 [Coriobacteriia bacterium]|nr:hypothetical protein [Coriobacteriia bacterium]
MAVNLDHSTYQELEDVLKGEFLSLGFIDFARKGQFNALRMTVDNKCDVDIQVSLPGYKTKITQQKVTYDYRVDIRNEAISHANIIVDLYSKSEQFPEKIRTVYAFLRDLFRTPLSGERFVTLLDETPFRPPSDTLLSRADRAHDVLNKEFGVLGNSQWSYSADELRYMISYIVMQEDINYPPPKYEGRKMPFSRYIEAILINEPTINTSYQLEDVIERALSHRRPKPFEELRNIYFQF